MFSFKGISAASKDILVQSVRRSITPPVSLEFQEYAGDGAYLINKKYESMKIEIDIFVSSSTQVALRNKLRDLANWLHSNSEQDLILDDEPDKKYLAILHGNTDLSGIVNTGQATLVFSCPSPFAIGITKKSVTPTANATTNHTYAGSAVSYPVITCTFTTAKTNYTLKNTAPDGTIYQMDLTYNFPSGAVLIVDMHEGSIKINGTDNMQTMNLVSDFWGLENGINKLWFPSGATVKVEYYERWL